MKAVRILKIILVILITCLTGFAPLNKDSAGSKLFFEPLGTNQGLSGNNVRAIYKDSEGLIWVGTNNGLNCYDGYIFRAYKPQPADSTSISGKIIYAIIEDEADNLWIGTWGNGLNLFDRTTQTFRHFKNDPGDPKSISHNWIMSLFIDSKGRLWIGTQNGLNLYNPESECFKRYLTNLNESSEPAQLRLSSLYDIKEDQNGNLWITTWSGLIMFNPETSEHYHYRRSNKRNSISTDSLQAIFIDDNNIIWVGSYKGTFEKIVPEYYRDTVIINIKHYPMTAHGVNGMSDNRVNGIVNDSLGNLWIATEYGLNFFDPVNEQFSNYYRDPNNQYSLSSNIINALFYDDEGILWIGTNDNGLSKLDLNYRKFTDHFPSINQTGDVNKKFVKSIHQDQNGLFWIGTDYGILLYNNDLKLMGNYTTLPGNPYGLNIGGVTGFFEDSLNNIWLSTWGGGMHKKHKNEIKFDNFSNQDDNNYSKYHPGDDDIRIMKLHPDGHAWLGTSRGFFDKFNPYTEIFEHYFLFDRDSLRGVPVVSIAFQPNNTIWAGAIQNGGLTRIDTEDGTIKRYFSGKDKYDLPTNEILSIFIDSRNKFWIGTDMGMVLFDPDKEEFNLVSGQKGLPSETVLAINEDPEGFLWLSTLNSLIKFHPVDSTVIIYDQTDGIFTSSSTSFLTAEGKMLFGGINGLNYFDPTEIYSNREEPEILFTDFRIKNESVDFKSSDSPIDKHINYVTDIVLNWEQSFFSIDFAAMNHSHSEKNQYAYKLEGLEKDWNYAGTKRTASYANLKPGNYVFRVMASNNDGIWNEEGRTLNISVRPPWWKSFLAFIVYVVIILTSVYLITRVIRMREQMRSELRMQQLEFEKQQALIKKEHEVDQMKLKFFTNISHEFRTPLTLIISPVNDILKSMRISPEVNGHLELVKKNAQRLLRLINQILDFSKVEAGFMKLEVGYGNISLVIENIVRSFEHRAKKHSIKYLYSASINNATGYFDLDKIEKILYNIISNAFKYTYDHGIITVDAKFEPEGSSLSEMEEIPCRELIVSVKDNGKGIPKDQIDLIFNRFHQIHTADTGTGIGLYLANSLTRIHQGSIEVSSELNKGTCFQLRIPLNKESYPPESILESLIEKDSFKSYFFSTEETLQNKEIEIPLRNNAPDMLIVEDEKDMQEYIKSLFRNEFTIYTADNGCEGLKLAKEHLPDIIICDVMMPEMDGIELTKILKESEETSHIMIILLTAKTSKSNILSGFETGADDYILKPFESDELSLKVKNIVETRKKFQKQFSSHPRQNLHKMTFNSMDKKIMESLLNTIEENISNPNLDYKLLCKSLGMSRAQLYRKIKALTDQTVHDFIRTVRLNKSLELILDRGLSVSEVMYKVGFNNHSYFSKCFKEKYGKSPSEYMQV